MGTIASVGLGGACAAAARAAMMAASPATTGCTTHQCDPSTTDLYPFVDAASADAASMDTASADDASANDSSPDDASADAASMDSGCVDGGGPHNFMIDENTFVTSFLDRDWLGFPGNGTLRIWFPPEVAGRTPLPPTGYVGIGLCPNGQFARDAGVNFAMAAGSLSEFNDVNTRPTQDDAGHKFGGSFEVTNVSCQFYYAYFQVNFVPVDAMAPANASAEAEADAAGATSTDGAPADATTE